MLNIIQEYNNHLDQIFEKVYDYVYLHDKKGNILDVNTSLVNNLGYSKNELLNMNITDFIVEGINPKLSNNIKKTIRTGVVNKPKTYKVKKKDGSFVYAEFSLIPLKKEGYYNAILGIGHDMTSNIKTTQKLKKSEEKYRLITENANDLIRVLNNKFQIEFVNETAHFNALGYLKEELIGITAISLNHPEDYTSIRRFIRKMIKTGENIHESRIRHKNGQWIWFEIKARKFKDEKGNTKYLFISRDITNRKNAEKKLKESEEKFRVITEQSFMSIMVIQDGIIKYFNERLPKRIGYSAEEIRNWKPYEFAKVIHPDDRDYVLEQAKKKQKGQRDIQEHYIYRSIRKDGSIGWVENFSKTINYEGKPADLVMAVEITDKLEAEQSLRESEEKFRKLFEKANDGILLINTETEQIFTGNKKICEMLGYSIEELKNLMFKDLHPKESLHYIDKLFEKNHQDSSSIAKDIPMKRKDGSIFYCNVNSSMLELTRKSYFMGIFRDITERKIAEQKLKESEEKFRNIAEQSFMGIIIIQDGEIKYLNKTISKISGYSFDEILKWTQKDLLKKIYPQDLQAIIERLQNNIKGIMPPFSNNSFRIINKNGEVRWLEDYSTKIIYQGKTANLISIIDITDKKEAELLIMQENERLLELHELRKDIITRVSHELKTPMTSIYGANQILIQLYMDQIGEEAQKYIEIGHRGSLRMKQLIDNLLDVSRLDAKKIELKLQNENIIELIIDSAKDMNYFTTNRQLKLRLNLPDELYIEIDRLRFRQVLTNIISNAIKNTPEGGEIYINLAENPDYVDIHVKDTGIGITEKEKEKLFEKFGKIERYGKDLGVDIEGSGLGLYIAKEFVELHGGKIYIESEGRNKGSTFTIRLFKK